MSLPPFKHSTRPRKIPINGGQDYKKKIHRMKKGKDDAVSLDEVKRNILHLDEDYNKR